MNKSSSKSAFFNPRTILAFSLCSCGVSLAMFSFAPPKPVLPALRGGPRLALLKPNLTRPSALAPSNYTSTSTSGASLAAPTSPSTPSFGHPVISGVGVYGFEEDIRLDPTDPDIVYTSAPDSASSDTRWIWDSRDG